MLTSETVGEGVKKTPCYDTPLSKEKLQQWRNEFWGKFLPYSLIAETRTSGTQEIWQLLRNACSADADTALALVKAAELTMPQNSLTTCIDHAGVYYRVPIACINDPNNYDQNT